MKQPEEQLEILSRGLVHIYNKEELEKKLKENRPLKVKAGFDPSRPDLHLGHSLLINKLRQFQELGHEVIFVVGDFTACIGDPSGQNKTRPVLSFEESQKNAQTYIEQAAKNNFEASKKLEHGSTKVFEFFKRLDSKKTTLVYNSKWFDKLSLKDFILDIASQFTLARQLERDDFKKRYTDEKPIALHELFYPLLQAYDSKELKADVELGGTDQLFNLLLGRELQKQYQQSPQVVLTLPLLKGTGKGTITIKWNRIHDLKAYLVYRKIKDRGENQKQLCEELNEDKSFKNDISLSSIKMKIENYRYLDTKSEGLKQYSKQSEEVYKEYKNNSIEQIEKVIEERKQQENWNIEGADKMSKSLDNAISFNEEPKEMYGKVMRISDERLADWWKLFTEGEEDLIELFKDKTINPKVKKEELAWLLVCSFYGEETASKEKEKWTKQFSKKELPEDISEYQDFLNEEPEDKALSNKPINKTNERIKQLEILSQVSIHIHKEKELLKKLKENRPLKLKAGFDPSQPDLHLGYSLLINKLRQCQELAANLKPEIELLEKEKTSKEREIGAAQLLKEIGLISSVNEARRKILEGAVKREGQKITDPHSKISLSKGDDILFSFGKRKFKRVNTKWDWIHNLKAYLVYRKMKDRGENKEQLCEELTEDKSFKNYISLSSIKMKIENYRYLDTKSEGLKQYSSQSEKVYKKYKNSSIEKVIEGIEKIEKVIKEIEKTEKVIEEIEKIEKAIEEIEKG